MVHYKYGNVPGREFPGPFHLAQGGGAANDQLGVRVLQLCLEDLGSEAWVRGAHHSLNNGVFELSQGLTRSTNQRLITCTCMCISFHSRSISCQTHDMDSKIVQTQNILHQSLLGKCYPQPDHMNPIRAQSLRVITCLEQPCSDDREVHLGVARHHKVDDVAPPNAEAAVEDPRHLPGTRLNLKRAKIV